jgi:predicted ATPase
MFEELTSKYFIGKSFKLDFDEDFNIKLIIQNIKNGNNIDVSMLSSGEYKILRIIKRIVFTKSRYIFLLDEPELSLSIFWQSMLLDDILKFGKQNKTIIATQSTYLINEKHTKYLIGVEDHESNKH